MLTEFLTENPGEDHFSYFWPPLRLEMWLSSASCSILCVLLKIFTAPRRARRPPRSAEERRGGGPTARRASLKKAAAQLVGPPSPGGRRSRAAWPRAPAAGGKARWTTFFWASVFSLSLSEKAVLQDLDYGRVFVFLKGSLKKYYL
uniref:Uncharacterized protein n=1 Tax=Oryza brachyantha TaxID=4533 RepID=J3LPT5_ORYBR